MRTLGAFIILWTLFVCPESAHARKFDFKSEVLATYFRASLGPSLLSDNAYGNSSGDSTTISSKVATNSSGEIGVVFSGTKANLRLGCEFLMPRDVTGVSGVNAAGTERFLMTSQVSAFVPTLNLEFIPYYSPTAKWIVGLGGGIALVSIENAYTMTATGTSELGVSDFTEKGSSQVSVGQIYTGYEVLFTDTVTAVFDVGYRYLPVKTLKSRQDTTAISGTYASGSEFKKDDGTRRSIDLGGFFAGFAFRFYIGL
jgi:hypothetical protein